jgi:hypothetical protein
MMAGVVAVPMMMIVIETSRGIDQSISKGRADQYIDNIIAAMMRSGAEWD